MNVLRKFIEKFRFLNFLKEPTSFNKFFIKLKKLETLKTLKQLFSLKSLTGLKLGLFLGVLALIISSSGVLYVYSQSGASGSIGGSSLNKGLIAHWSLDADEYEEGTVNLAPYTNYSNRNYNQVYTASCWGGDAATVEYFSSGGYNNLPYKKLIKTAGGTGGCYIDEHYGINIENNKTYIISAYIKASRNISSVAPYVIGLNRTATNTYRNGPYLNLTTEWQRFSWVYNAGADHAGIYSNRGIVYEDNSLPLEIYWSGFQVEEKSYATPFVSGARTDRVVDGTPYLNHGTNYGATPTTDRHGKEGGAMSFNGVSNRISISYPNPVNETSVVAWFKRSGSPAGGYHIITGGGNIEISIPDSSGQIRTGVTTNTQGRKVFNSGSGLNDGNWHQVAMTYDGSNLKSFIDGQITATNPVSGNLVGIAGEIGRFLSDSYVTNGSIDDVRIYNRALSEEEVALLYDSYEPKIQISSINSGLVGHWTLSEEDYNSSTNQLADKTPYSNHAINSGATFTTDRHGKAGGAMSFNSGNTISISNNNSLTTDSLSISFWAYHRDYTPSKTFSPIKKSSPNCYAAGGKGWDFGHGYKSNGVDVCVADGNNIVRQTLLFDAGTNPPDLLNKWSYITYIIDRSQNKVLAYINGVKQSNEVNIASITGDINSGSNLIVGNLYGWVLDGSIDDLRIYNRILSEEEISLLYNSYTPQTGGDSLQKGLILDMPLTSKYTKTETSGSQIMIDKTPYGNDGQNYGAVITDEGASFDGVSNFYTLTNNTLALNSSQTYSVWIKPDSVTDGLSGVLTTHSHAITSNIGINKIANKFNISIGYTDGTREYSNKDSVYSIIPNEWQHVVLVYNHLNNSVSFYINGNFDKTWNLTKTVKFTSQKALVGMWSNNYYSAYRFNGKISNAKIYNRALSEKEIKLLYTKDVATLGGVPIYRKSCKEILDANSNNSSGIYQIQPISTEPPFSVFCDMTTDGGGWTLVEKDYGGSATVPISSASDTNTAILTDQNWSTAEGKFADSKLKAIWLAGNRELLWRKSTGEYIKIRYSDEFINNYWFSNFTYSNRPTGVFQEFYRYADSTWYAINGHSNNWHFSNYNDGRNISPYSSYLMAKNQNDGDSYWPTRTTGLMDNTSFMFHIYIR